MNELNQEQRVDSTPAETASVDELNAKELGVITGGILPTHLPPINIPADAERAALDNVGNVTRAVGSVPHEIQDDHAVARVINNTLDYKVYKLRRTQSGHI
jgi:hypothetical protein